LELWLTPAGPIAEKPMIAGGSCLVARKSITNSSAQTVQTSFAPTLSIYSTFLPSISDLIANLIDADCPSSYFSKEQETDLEQILHNLCS
jgi:hypothetical protein